MKSGKVNKQEEARNREEGSLWQFNLESFFAITNTIFVLLSNYEMFSSLSSMMEV
jgi:hypothetical protein